MDYLDFILIFITHNVVIFITAPFILEKNIYPAALG